MAVKPIISQTAPWDATLGGNITFSYSGNLPVTAKGIVRNASTLEVRLTLEQPAIDDGNGRYTFYIPPNTLKANAADTNGNGSKYCIQISVTDLNGNVSPISDKGYFWCLETPQFYYTYPGVEETVENKYVTLELFYSQSNGEKIYTYRHYLYDNSRNLIRTSDPFYDESGYIYTFKDLDNKTSYYLRTQGYTKSGMIIDTGYVQIYTNYYSPETYSILQLDSDKNATVYGSTNMILIDADENPDDYIFFNSTVQLEKKKITYQTNYRIARDFTMQIKITKALYSGVILEMFNKNNTSCVITLDSYYFDDGLLRYCLKAFNGVSTYVLYTDGLEVTNDDFIMIVIRRVNDVFSLDAFICDD